MEYGIYQVSAVAIDNYGKRSEKVTILATPAKEDTIDPDIIVENKLPIADPFVLYYEGKYYAYGTRVNGFEVYISEDLKQWKRNDIKCFVTGKFLGNEMVLGSGSVLCEVEESILYVLFSG